MVRTVSRMVEKEQIERMIDMTKEQFLELFGIDEMDDFFISILEENGGEEENINWFEEAKSQISTMNALLMEER